MSTLEVPMSTLRRSENMADQDTVKSTTTISLSSYNDPCEAICNSATTTYHGDVAGAPGANLGERFKRSGKILANMTPIQGNKRKFLDLPIWCPESKIARWQNMFIALILLYIAVMVPLNMAFDDFDALPWPLEVSLVLVFIIDMGISFRIAYYDDDQVLITDERACASHYLRTYFPFDLIGSFPIATILTPVVSNKAVMLTTVLRFFRVKRIYRGVESTRGTTIWRLFILLIGWFLTAHWVACGFFWLGSAELREGNGSWVSPTLLNSSVWDQYSTALYFAMATVTGTGFGDLHPVTMAERSLCTFVFFLSAMVYAFIFGTVASVVQHGDQQARNRATMQEDLRRFLHKNDIPMPMRAQLRNYVVQSISRHASPFDPGPVLQGLPPAIAVDVSMFIHSPRLTRVFPHCTEHVYKRLAMALRYTFCIQGQYLAHQGDSIDEMVFIHSGAVELVCGTADNTVDLLGPLDAIGLEMIKTSRIIDTGTILYSSNAIALSFCDLFTLSRKDAISAFRSE